MRTRESGPCALVAGDEPGPVARRVALFVIMILLWLETNLIDGFHLPTLLAVLAGAGFSLGSGVRGPWALRVHLRLSVAVGDGAGRLG